MCRGHSEKNVLTGNVTAPLKEGVTQRETHHFADTVTLAAGSRGKSQRGQRGAREVAGVEMREEIRCHLRSQGVHVLRRGDGVEGSPVDKLQRPGSHSQDDIVTTQLVSPLDDQAQSYMCERAADVRVHLNQGHDFTPCQASTRGSRGDGASRHRLLSVVM